MMQNQLDEEKERRHSALFMDLLAVMNRRADGAHSFVEIISTTDIRLVTRYTTADMTVHEIIQSISLNYGSRPIS